MEAMTTEQQEVIETPQVEQTEVEAKVEVAPVDDDAAFLAGFKGEELPAAPAAEEPEPEPEPQPEPTPEPEPKLTADEIAVLRAKAAEVDRLRETTAKLSGSLGAMRQAIDNLKNGPKQAATPSFKRLSQLFPEMAKAITEDFAEGGPAAAAAPSVDVDAMVEEKLATRLQQQQQAVETKLLSVMHPDWKAVVPSDEFSKWKASLDPETQQSLDNSWDAEFIGQKLSEFKDWKKQTAASVQSKQRRLEAAITPKGSPNPPAQTDEDAFYAGFKSARGIR